ncbi:glycosyltransferase family 2 protein [Desulfatitalea alkaliphila]|uniref:Glycosyltransferase family 2 protein n=1 Tax=Desulfatitalea alkaliphila TaxID=2929485 RepID=A0AA41R7E1_9BACT|nr:glycosyltransferase family 2 protein [Desulfatitalea alkaliphila]MCJ8503001.1 glycosyltransferase family 2 protein [Desulfatitalea alkaliphila]
MAELFFFLLLLCMVYSYTLFPALLWLMKHFVKHPWKRVPGAAKVSIIISVYNEEKVIQAKIENALALDYPPELLEVVVSSDGSTDSTNDIVGRFADSRVVLKRFDRLGKTACLNRVVPQVGGDVVLFTDANSMFPKDLLTHLVANFSDPNVGLVTGWTRYIAPGGGEEVTGLYAKLERYTKYWECLIDSCVGADGAVFAIRKALYQPLGADDINDFVIPLNVIKQKKRVVLDPAVFCREEAVDSDQKAYRRQVRITTRTLWAIRRHLFMLNLARHGYFAFFLWSHKVLRLAAPLFFVLALLMNIALVGHSWFFNMTFAGFMLFLFSGLISLAGLTKNKVASICKFFLITFTAQIAGWVRMAAGIRDTTWTPQR